MHAPHPGHWHLLLLPPALGLHSCTHPSWQEPEQSFPPVGGKEITVFPVIGTRCTRFNIGWHTKWFLSTAYTECSMFDVECTLFITDQNKVWEWYSLVGVPYGVDYVARLYKDLTDNRWHKNALYTYSSFQVQLGPTVSQERHNVAVTLLSC